MIRASIDIGSNSTLLLIAEFAEGKITKVFESESKITGLGKKLDTSGYFLEESMNDTFSALSEYVNKIKNYNIPLNTVVVTATEAARVAKNSIEFFYKITLELGLNVVVITGEGEAYYSTMGVLADSKKFKSPLVILDIGGASTELIKVDVEKSEILNSISMPVGSVRVTNWKENNELESRLKDIGENFKEDLLKMESCEVCCVAGTMTSIANMLMENQNFEEEKVHGYNLNSESVRELKNKIQNLSVEELKIKYPFLGKRAGNIQGGIEVALFVINSIKNKSMYVSTYGLRYGTLKEGRIDDKYFFIN